MVELIMAPSGGLKIIDKSYMATPNVVLDANGYVIAELKPGAAALKMTVENNDTAASHPFEYIYQFIDKAGNLIYEYKITYTVAASGVYTLTLQGPLRLANIRILVRDPNNTGQLVLQSIKVSAFEFVG